MSRRTWLTSHVMSAGYAIGIWTLWYRSAAVDAAIGTILIGIAWAIILWQLGPNHKTGASGA